MANRPPLKAIERMIEDDKVLLQRAQDSRERASRAASRADRRLEKLRTYLDDTSSRSSASRLLRRLGL